MALVDCGECGGKVSQSAKACPHCGSPAKKVASGRIGCLPVVGLVAVVVIALVVIVQISNSPTGAPAVSATDQAALLAQCRGTMDSLQKAGVVLHVDTTVVGSEAHFDMVVNKALWDLLPYTAKSGAADAAACIASNGDKGLFSGGTVYDDMDHDELGKMSSLSGEFTSDEPVSGQ